MAFCATASLLGLQLGIRIAVDLSGDTTPVLVLPYTLIGIAFGALVLFSAANPLLLYNSGRFVRINSNCFDSLSPEERSHVEKVSERPKRPRGVTWLSVLHLASSPFYLLSMVMALSLSFKVGWMNERIPHLSEFLDMAGASYLIVALLLIASGIGLWTGKTWGWYVASLIHLYNLLRNILSLGLTILQVQALSPEEVAQLPNTKSSILFEQVVQAGLAIFFYMYLFSENVRAYFLIWKERRLSLIGSQIVIAVFVLALISFLVNGFVFSVLELNPDVNGVQNPDYGNTWRVGSRIN
jgi:hypothetical protein